MEVNNQFGDLIDSFQPNNMKMELSSFMLTHIHPQYDQMSLMKTVPDDLDLPNWKICLDLFDSNKHHSIIRRSSTAEPNIVDFQNVENRNLNHFLLTSWKLLNIHLFLFVICTGCMQLVVGSQ